MRRSGAFRALLTGAAVTAVSTALVAFAGAGANAAAPKTSQAGKAMPAHVVAPYFEAWTGESPAALAAASGNKYLTLAFLQTDAAGSCSAYWNGDTSLPVSKSAFGTDIAAIQARGGNVIP